ncbi:MAG TPA: hypothetical protein VGR35_01900 [Tepidisphaeraceae bacterium]|nr:hypothetical protein [Tepidisphaeraceae bacterium]
MGKSVDLPDPLESAASQPLGSADDLLAQLAGEEVDRLLAEADAEGKQHPRPAEGRRADDASPADLAAAVLGPSPAPQASIQDQLDALFAEFTGEKPSAEPPSDAPSAPAANMPAVAPIAPGPYSPVMSRLPDDIDANEVMAAILGDLDPTSPEPDALPPVETQAIVATPRAASAPASMLTARRVETETSVAERQGLSAPAPADALPGPGELELLSAPIEEDAPLPAYLKPLEWMNAPLDLLPSTIRDVLGQIAILTLINAIAVLIYVFVFRKS